MHDFELNNDDKILVAISENQSTFFQTSFVNSTLFDSQFFQTNDKIDSEEIEVGWPQTNVHSDLTLFSSIRKKCKKTTAKIISRKQIIFQKVN